MVKERSDIVWEPLVKAGEPYLNVYCTGIGKQRWYDSFIRKLGEMNVQMEGAENRVQENRMALAVEIFGEANIARLANAFPGAQMALEPHHALSLPSQMPSRKPQYLERAFWSDETQREMELKASFLTREFAKGAQAHINHAGIAATMEEELQWNFGQRGDRHSPYFQPMLQVRGEDACRTFLTWLAATNPTLIDKMRKDNERFPAGKPLAGMIAGILAGPAQQPESQASQPQPPAKGETAFAGRNPPVGRRIKRVPGQGFLSLLDSGSPDITPDGTGKRYR